MPHETIWPFQQVDEQFALVLFADEGNVLLNAVGRGRFGADVNADRLVQHVVGKAADGLWHGRTEHQVLTSFGHETKNAVNVFVEPPCRACGRLHRAQNVALHSNRRGLVRAGRVKARRGHQHVHPLGEGL